MTRRRSLIAVEITVVLLLLPIGVGALYVARLDPAVVKARIAQEVQRATGRDLVIGPVRLVLFPELAIDADAVGLANPPGFSRPLMLTARHLHARVALLPLLFHHVVVRQLALTAPDLRLERRADGGENWRFDPARPSARLPDAVRTGHAGRLRLDSLVLLDLAVTDGAVSWVLPGQGGGATVATARLQEVNASSTMHLSLAGAVAGAAVSVEGRFGGQSHLWTAADRSPWPVEATVTADGGKITIGGTMTDPRRLAGYDVTIAAHGPDLGPLVAVMGWPEAPRLHDVSLETRIIDRIDGIDVPRLSLSAGASDLSASVAGLTLATLMVAAPNIDGTSGTQTNRLIASGGYGGQKLAIDGTLGPVGRLLGRGPVGARSPIRIDATAQAAGGTLSVRGRVAPGGDWRGTDVAVRAAIPDLAALSPLAGRALPGLRDVALAANLRSVGGALVLSDAHLSSDAVSLDADGSAQLAGRPRYDGRITVARADLDAMRAAWPTVTAAAVGSAKPAASGPNGEAWVIPDRPLDLAPLRARDADVTLSVGHMIEHGVRVDGLTTRIRLAAGRLDVDPFIATVAGSMVSGRASIDAGRAPPTAAIDVQAPGLDLATVMALAGLGADAAGTIDLDAMLAGEGATPHAIAATLTGHLGLALTTAEIDNRVLAAGLARLVPASHGGLSLPAGGRSAVRCLATRLDFADGIGVPRAFLLDLDRFSLTAAGAVDVGRETLALRLRPYLRLGRTGLILPSRADGAWSDPHLTLEPAHGAASASAITIGLIGTRGDRARTVSALLAGVGGASDTLLADADSGDCGPSLAIARDTSRDTAPQEPATASTLAPTPRQRAFDLLRRLFRRPG